MDRWRLLHHGAATGPWNMAVDEALLASAAEDGVASLRLYTWDGPWLSLGYGQELTPARRAACAAAGVGVVRRPSGGRAVLHGADLTYTIAAPAHALPAGLEASYALVVGALIRALAKLGIEARRGRPRPGSGRDFDCFANPAADGVWVGEKKLAGSAQCRRRGGVLQHGSIRLAPDSETVARGAGLWPPRATSLAELGIADAAIRLPGLLVEALTATLNSSSTIGGLTPREIDSARSAEADPAPELRRRRGGGSSRAPAARRYRS